MPGWGSMLCWPVVFWAGLAPTAALSPAAVDRVKQWAPLVWLHSQEPFLPSTVQFHLHHTEVNCPNYGTLY